MYHLRLTILIFLVALSSAVAQQQPIIVTSEDTLAVSTPFGGATGIIGEPDGWYYQVSGTWYYYSINKGLMPTVIAAPSQLPAGYSMSTGGSLVAFDGQGRMYLAAQDKAANPSVIIMMNDGTGLKSILSPNDRMTGTSLTYIRAFRLSAQGGKLMMLADVGPSTHLHLIIFDGKNWTDIVDLITSPLTLIQISQFLDSACLSDGQVSATWEPGPWAYRMNSNGSWKQVLSDISKIPPAVLALQCTEFGAVAVHSQLDPQGGSSTWQLASIANGSIQEQTVFSGSSIAEIPLGPGFTFSFIGTTKVVIAPGTGGLFKVADGKASVVVEPNKQPLNGIPIPWYGEGRLMLGIIPTVQNLVLSGSYFLFQPSLTATTYSGPVGGKIKLVGTDLVVNSQLPTVACGTATTSVDTDLSFTSSADLNGNCTVNVGGISLPFTLTVGPPMPIISSILDGATMKADPLALGMITIIVGQNFGSDTVVMLDGQTLPIDLLSPTQINTALLDSTHIDVDNHTIRVISNGVPSADTPVKVVSQNFAAFQIPLPGGLLIPMIIDQDGNLLGDPALSSDAFPLAQTHASSQLGIIGTGGGKAVDQDGNLMDDTVPDPAGPYFLVQSPNVQIDGVEVVPLFEGRLTGTRNKDIVKLQLPDDLTSGQHNVKIADNLYSFWVN
jgi:uncharacterized protein (TIGR03437 family)